MLMQKFEGSKVRARTLIWAVALVIAPLPAAAQFPAPPEAIPAPAKPAPKAPPKPVERPKPRPARAGEAQTDPIKCWWKADTTEVRIGQRFNVTLTCGVIETPSTIGVRASPAERSAPPSMKKIIMPLLHTNMIRRKGSASALTAGAALTRSSSVGAST